jgi:hypothetical protein
VESGERERPAITIPEDEPAAEPSFAFVGWDDDGRDATKPVGYDEHGQPLYAPRGGRRADPLAVNRATASTS